MYKDLVQQTMVLIAKLFNLVLWFYKLWNMCHVKTDSVLCHIIFI